MPEGAGAISPCPGWRSVTCAGADVTAAAQTVRARHETSRDTRLTSISHHGGGRAGLLAPPLQYFPIILMSRPPHRLRFANCAEGGTGKAYKAALSAGLKPRPSCKLKRLLSPGEKSRLSLAALVSLPERI